VKKISGDPLDITIDCMKEVSISLAKTVAKTMGATGNRTCASVADHAKSRQIHRSKKEWRRLYAPISVKTAIIGPRMGRDQGHARPDTTSGR